MSAEATMARGADAEPAFRLGLIGGFGGANTGNDATADVVLDHLRRYHPDVDASLVVYHAVRGVGPGGAPLISYVGSYVGQSARGAARGRLSRLAEKPLGIVADVRRARATARALDALVVLGGGVFEGESTADVGLRGAASFVSLARAARRFAFIAVGASPSSDRLKRAVARLTLGSAEDTSFRDEASIRAAAAMGADVRESRVTCDLVFARRRPGAVPPSETTRIAVGVMGFPWLRRTEQGSVDPDDPYVRELSQVVREALRRGWRVDLFVGDGADIPTMRAVEAAAHASPDEVPADRLRSHDDLQFDVLLEKIGACHVVIFSRFHNLVAGLLAGRPAVALADRVKVRELMADFGLASSVLEARSFTSEAVLRKVDEALEEWVSRHLAIEERAALLHTEAGAELDRLSRRIRDWQRTTGRSPIPTTMASA